MVNFREIEINKTEISQSVLNIDSKTRSSLYTWNGQFSPQFVEALLNKYANSSDIVLDPFSGSGTVLVEAGRKNIAAYGIELNPSAFFFSKMSEVINIPQLKRVDIVKICDMLVQNIINSNNILQNLQNAINYACNDTPKYILETLLICMDIFKNEITPELMSQKWNKLKTIINTLPFSDKSITAIQGDSRNKLLPNNAASLVLTSPPYINVFNYHQNYRRSVEALGYNVLSIARSEIGSNRKFRGNRLFTVVQYCIDIALTFNQLSECIVDNGRIIFVVGRESCVLGYSFCNSELVYLICERIFGNRLLLRQERVFKNRFGTMIYEDILHFKNSKQTKNRDEIVFEAASIAEEILNTKLSCQNKNIEYLLSAIENTHMIKPSEGLI